MELPCCLFLPLSTLNTRDNRRIKVTKITAVLITKLDYVLDLVKGYVTNQHSHIDSKWDLGFHTYGKADGSGLATSSPEVFIIAEALAPTQELANSLAMTAKVACIHGSYPGQKATSGNMAFGIGGKASFELGPCPEFSIYHLMDLKGGEEGLRIDDDATKARGLFRQQVHWIGAGANLPRGQKSQAAPASPNSGVVNFNGTGNTTTGNATTNGHSSPPRTNGIAMGVEVPDTNGIHTIAAPPAILGDLAKILRSKNAGPYEITFDISFDSEPVYQLVKDSGLLSASRIAEAIGFPEEELIWSGFFDPAMAFKATVPRFKNGKRAAAGGFMEHDVHGSQQYLGLRALTLPPEFIEKWRKIQETPF